MPLYYVVPSISQVIFSRKMKIIGYFDVENEFILQLTVWKHRDQLGIVGFDINTQQTYMVQPLAQQQAEHIAALRFMPSDERYLYITMYILIDLRLDEITEEVCVCVCLCLCLCFVL